MRLLVLLLSAPLAALAAEPVCPAQSYKAARFAPGETLGFKLDLLGADVGSFEITLEAPPAGDRPRVALVAKSRAHTSAFVSTNVGMYQAFATTLLGPDLAPLKYREEVDEGATHKAQEVDFPPLANGKLAVHATKNGEPDPFELLAGPSARDILSTLYLLRAQPMAPGQPVCVEVFAGRKLWRLSGQVAAREMIDTPLGKFTTLRVDAVAVRTDDTNIKRGAHVWVTDDARRLPLVAIGEVKGKTIRAQLVRANGVGILRQAKEDHRRVGNSIGR